MLVRAIFEILHAINREEKVAMLLVEQNAAQALDIADHAYVLETGRVMMSGTAQAVRSDEAVRRSYLGY
jgi:branched-chain amino acid transport system ATP-binding protein